MLHVVSCEEGTQGIFVKALICEVSQCGNWYKNGIQESLEIITKMLMVQSTLCLS